MRLLFVCTGNTCRSPLAEAVARRIAIERGLHDVEVASAGTSAWDNAAASDAALLVGLERRLDLNGHRAQLLTADLVRWADVVLTMGPHHLERVLALGGGSRAHLLTEFASHGASTRAVSDPFGGELEVYRATVTELEGEIQRVFDRITAERASEHP